MKILITGSNGQLGMSFRKIAPEHPEHDFFFYGSKELDITSYSSIEKAFKETQPDVVINCAAYTAVDKAEEEPEKAFAVNAEGVKHLVEACKLKKTALIHISTDYVFDGRKDSPYLETDPTNPISVYGESKLAGEKYILKSKLKAFVVRTSWLYSEFGNNFLKTMLRLGQECSELKVVSDQFGSPTYASDLAHACLTLVRQIELKSNEPVVYHFSNIGEINWYEFAATIMKQAKLSCNVLPINSEAYPTKAIRPSFSKLRCKKIEEDYQVTINTWKTSLKKSISNLIP